MPISCHRDLLALPAAHPVWRSAADYGTSYGWFAATQAAALPHGARPVYLLHDGTTLFPMMAHAGRLKSMTTPYTWDFAPLGRADAAAMAAFGAACAQWPVVSIEALDAGWPGLGVLEAGLRAAGFRMFRYAHFGNWNETLARRNWAAYLAARPGRLREVLRRRGRDARDSVRYEMIAAPGDVTRGIAAYEQVYARSWKVPEPYPAFGPALLRQAAGEGMLRLALAWRDDVPIAAQYWVLGRGTASVLKLAHDEAAKALSPGTLLTAWTIRHLIEEDGVQKLDFGRGDDGYKQLWATERRQTIGLIGGLPWRAAGLAVIVRQTAGILRLALRGMFS